MAEEPTTTSGSAPDQASNDLGMTGMEPISDGEVTAPGLVPMDDDAGGPTADKEQMDEPGEEEAAAQLGTPS